MVRFGVLGCGRGGFLAGLAAALPDQLAVTATCDLRFERAVALAEKCPGARVCATYDELLAQPDLDAVFVATPDHLHAGQALQALAAGKHVLSEIPAAYTIAELRQLIALAQSTGKKYLMGNEVRWFPALQAAQRRAAHGEFGKVFYGEAEYLHNLLRDGWKTVEPDGSPHWRWDPAQPQTTLLGGGPHAFDTLRWLTGEPQFVEVFAYGVGQSVAGHPEPATTVCLLKGESGAAYKITVSYAMVRPYCLYFSLYGDKGSFEGGRAVQTETYACTVDALEWKPTGEPYWSDPNLAVAVGHGTSEYFMVREFLDAIADDREPAIGPIEAARSIAPAICAFTSIQTGKPVAVPCF